MSRGRRILRFAALLLLATAGAGAVYEAVARRRAAREFTPPGRLVDVGGRRIHMDCRGTGSPTVVLEAGLDTFGAWGWMPVHDSLAAVTRTCAYSRTGMMWSDSAPGAFDSRRAAGDLHAALAASGERAPWVLVGHSLGGPYALAFTGRYPAEVAGLVLVDASHPDQTRGARPPLPRRARNAAILAAAPVLARLGVARLAPVRRAPDEWPPRMAAAHAAFFPTSGTALAKEARALDATLRTAGRARRLGDRPLVVLTATIGDPQHAAAWNRMQADQATWSTRGRQRMVDATHYIHFDRPEAVVGAVEEVVAEVRKAGAPSSAATARP